MRLPTYRCLDMFRTILFQMDLSCSGFRAAPTRDGSLEPRPGTGVFGPEHREACEEPYFTLGRLQRPRGVFSRGGKWQGETISSLLVS